MARMMYPFGRFKKPNEVPMGLLPVGAALEKLKAGNARFAAGRTDGPGCVGPLHAELIQGQRPFAIVLSCADSRVPPEIVFDTGLGELFAVRVAGNVANTSSIASIEFAVANLGTRLVVVMAHADCGAVGAAIGGVDAGKNLNRLLSYIQPAIDGSGDVDAVARRNAALSAEALLNRSTILGDAVRNDGVVIATAFFDFATGVVEFD